MKNALIAFLLLTGCLMLQFCTTSKSAASSKTSDTAVSYQHDVAPILKERCTPCHFPDGGKKKFLDTYAAARDNIDDMLHRVSLPTEADGFMPFKSKKEPLNDSQIQVLVAWKASGFPN
jgi:hypothetical protein